VVHSIVSKRKRGWVKTKALEWYRKDRRPQVAQKMPGSYGTKEKVTIFALPGQRDLHHWGKNKERCILGVIKKKLRRDRRSIVIREDTQPSG